MRKTLLFILVLIFLFSFVGCQNQKAIQQEVVDYVEKNYDLLVEYCSAGNTAALSALDMVEKVAVTDGYILVYCKGSGIAPSSQDYGFYYSADHLPVAIDCNLDIICSSENLTPEGVGYQYVHNGNVFYTEHILGNLYLYSNAY